MDKEKIEIIVYTKEMKIVGKIHLLSHERFSDFLHGVTIPFISIKDVSFYNILTGQVNGHVEELNLNKSEIVIIFLSKDMI
jgi:hypothetical protein